jgi:hypothetical protein
MKRRLTVVLLAVVVCMVGAYQSGIYPASGQTHTPTSTTEQLGSISGQVFVDVNNDGTFGGPDVPLQFPLNLFGVDANGAPQPPFDSQSSASDGSYHFDGLPSGKYQIWILIPIAAGCPAPNSPFTWVGDTFSGLSCASIQLSTPSREIVVSAGENVTGVDLPEIPRSYDVTARVWLDGQALSGPTPVIVTVSGHPCWSAQIAPVITFAEIIISYYNATLSPFEDPACQHGDLDMTINGRSAGATTQWDRFWRDSLFSSGARPLNQSSDAFLQSADLALPPFLGIWGQVVEAGTVTPENPAARRLLVEDGTEIKAFVGATLCGSSPTKTLTGSQGQFAGNLFSLIVPPTSVKAGCGTSGAAVTFCVGDLKARQPAAGPFSSPQSAAQPLSWAAPALADITLEPTTERCVATEPPPLPVSLPQTGGPPH